MDRITDNANNSNSDHRRDLKKVKAGSNTVEALYAKTHKQITGTGLRGRVGLTTNFSKADKLCKKIIERNTTGG